jgi:glycosyltransferase involved in cell wall biosynthesis
MRILMLNNEFPPLGGGTGTVNRALLQQFAQMRQLEIDLVTSALGSRQEQERFDKRVQIYKVPVHNANIHHSSNLELLAYAARALPAALRLHRARPYDFCFAWSAVPAGGVALALRRLLKLPYIVRVCGPDIPGFEQRYGPLYPVLTPAIRAVWRGAAAVVAKCAGEADMIRAVDPGVAISLVANGVDLTAFSPAQIPEAGTLRLICVARLIERKGQRQLIEAVRRLLAEGISVSLDLVGDGDADAAYRALAHEAGVAQAVRFVGYVAREQIAAHYAAAHVFVLPSYNEGMSVATLEAMAAGLPLVVTRTGGTADLVSEEINGLTFDWADVERLTAHLRRLATERGLARRMGMTSRARAERFSWESAAARYAEMFDLIATGARSGRPNTEVVR